jgi:hypothetical protein
MIPVRALVDMLAVTVTVTKALPEPLVGDTASQDALSVTLQLTGDVIEKVWLPAAGPNEMLVCAKIVGVKVKKKQNAEWNRLVFIESPHSILIN